MSEYRRVNESAWGNHSGARVEGGYVKKERVEKRTGTLRTGRLGGERIAVWRKVARRNPRKAKRGMRLRDDLWWGDPREAEIKIRGSTGGC